MVKSSGYVPMKLVPMIILSSRGIRMPYDCASNDCPKYITLVAKCSDPCVTTVINTQNVFLKSYCNNLEYLVFFICVVLFYRIKADQTFLL
jgi:hypothetical protein